MTSTVAIRNIHTATTSIVSLRENASFACSNGKTACHYLVRSVIQSNEISLICGAMDPRRVDGALWQFGKFLTQEETFHTTVDRAPDGRRTGADDDEHYVYVIAL